MPTPDTPDAPDDEVRPLAVTADEDLLDELLRIAEACGVAIDVAHDVGTARTFWSDAPIVLLGADVAESIARGWPARRNGVVLVARERLEQLGHDAWQDAIRIGADDVLALPEHERRLAERLADACAGTDRTATTVCVVGGRGGAGASTLAVALGLLAHRAGVRTILVDGDPLSGGLDLVLGGEDAVGIRWTELAAADGAISPRALWQALPCPDGLPVVSSDRDGSASTIPPTAMRSVLTAAKRAAELLVVDLPRHIDETSEVALVGADTALLVVPSEVRAVAASVRVAAALTSATSDVRIVVRGPAPARLTSRDIADAIGLPLAGALAAEPGLARRLERGQPPARRHGPLADFCRSFLRDRGLVGRRAA